jgi:hypothetical protein
MNAKDDDRSIGGMRVKVALIGDISFEAAADPDTCTRPEYSLNSNAF